MDIKLEMNSVFAVRLQSESDALAVSTRDDTLLNAQWKALLMSCSPVIMYSRSSTNLKLRSNAIWCPVIGIVHNDKA